MTSALLRLALCVVCFLLLVRVASGQSPDVLQAFDEGNARYQAGAYADAVAAYERALEDDVESVALYHNLGNAHFRQDHLGQAIRYYEKARRLDPDHPAVLHSLQIAQIQQIDQMSQLPPPFWQPFLSVLHRTVGTTGLFLLGFLLFGTGLGLLTHRRWRRVQAPWHRRTRSISLGLGLLLLLLAFATSWQHARDTPAVVVVQQAILVDAPQEDAPVQRRIHEGLIVRVVETQSEWVSVQLPNGQAGWLPADVLARV